MPGTRLGGNGNGVFVGTGLKTVRDVEADSVAVTGLPIESLDADIPVPTGGG